MLIFNGDCILPANQINVEYNLKQEQIIVHYCLLYLQKTSEDLSLWLVCTFDLELININFCSL